MNTALAVEKWKVGDSFGHRTWLASKQDRSPWVRYATCEVIAVRNDSYRGEMIQVVTVREEGGTRTMSYRADRLPWTVKCECQNIGFDFTEEARHG